MGRGLQQDAGVHLQTEGRERGGTSRSGRVWRSVLGATGCSTAPCWRGMHRVSGLLLCPHQLPQAPRVVHCTSSLSFNFEEVLFHQKKTQSDVESLVKMAFWILPKTARNAHNSM